MVLHPGTESFLQAWIDGTERSEAWIEPELEERMSVSSQGGAGLDRIVGLVSELLEKCYLLPSSSSWSWYSVKSLWKCKFCPMTGSSSLKRSLFRRPWGQTDRSKDKSHHMIIFTVWIGAHYWNSYSN